MQIHTQKSPQKILILNSSGWSFLSSSCNLKTFGQFCSKRDSYDAVSALHGAKAEIYSSLVSGFRAANPSLDQNKPVTSKNEKKKKILLTVREREEISAA